MSAAPAAILVGGRTWRPGTAFASSSLPPHLIALVRRLAAAGVDVTPVEDLDEARALTDLTRMPSTVAMDDSGLAPRPAARILPILLDLESIEGDDPDDLAQARLQVTACRAAVPEQPPIAITAQAPPRLLLECMRAGADDVIDLGHEGTTHARAAVLRAIERERQRRAELEATRELRRLLDELVRDLVRTERRTIDLERQIEGGRPELGDPLYLERIKARHEQVLARYLAATQGRR